MTGLVAPGERSDGVFATLSAVGVPYRLCSHGKVALTAALDLLDATGNVLLPACIPAGVVGTLRARGVTPRFYRVQGDLQVAYADLLRRADSDTDALVVVHYFGIPQPRMDDLLDLAATINVPVIDDNSHAALSRRGDRLLGTEGTVGFTSLHKTLPVPNGAVLYGRGVDLPSNGAPAWSRTDLRFCAGRVLSRLPSLPHPDGRDGDGETDESDADTTDPQLIHERARVPLSPLTPPLLSRIDPERVVERRCASYRRWAALLDGVEGIEPLFGALPDGACPWMFPAICADPDAVLAALDGRGFVWPRLPPAVAGDPEYPVANACARRLVALPVGGVAPATIDRLAEAIGAV